MSIYSYKRTPNEICVDLNEMGIESTFDSGTRQEQEIANIENWVGENWVAGYWIAGYWIADGLIDIKEGPITWIAIGRDSNGGDSGGYPEGTDTSWMVYGIPDSKVSDSYPKVKLYPSRIKTFPIFGKVVDVRWRGKDFGLGVADRLYEDILIRNQLMVSLGVADDTGSGTEEVLGGSIGGLHVTALPSHECWVISARPSIVLFTPTKQLWDCYCKIAQRLLATPSPLNI